jgi:hypothetical protein
MLSSLAGANHAARATNQLPAIARQLCSEGEYVTLVDPIQRFCREMQNQGDYAIADCLKTNTRRLSSACRRVIEAGSR